mmetsp:Transcript_23527/g.67383  ORF Transcript_23527/g.67383 Transcript_23527/m.67383 type:complete len:204 (-) Transcript_23527:265-876(-)
MVTPRQDLSLDADQHGVQSDDGGTPHVEGMHLREPGECMSDVVAPAGVDGHAGLLAVRVLCKVARFPGEDGPAQHEVGIKAVLVLGNVFEGLADTCILAVCRCHHLHRVAGKHTVAAHPALWLVVKVLIALPRSEGRHQHRWLVPRRRLHLHRWATSGRRARHLDVPLWAESEPRTSIGESVATAGHGGRNKGEPARRRLRCW